MRQLRFKELSKEFSHCLWQDQVCNCGKNPLDELCSNLDNGEKGPVNFKDKLVEIIKHRKVVYLEKMLKDIFHAKGKWYQKEIWIYVHT